MPGYRFMLWAAGLTGVAFVFAFGAICGSFINVLVYRLPRGINVVTPPSSCPACGTKLTWRENFPVFGWLALRGRCRFCKSTISPEYPLVEFIVGTLFASVFFLWFLDPTLLGWLGIEANGVRPDWARNGFPRVWPMGLLVVLMIGMLVAVTLIDARTFLIPLILPWIIAGLALVVHPIHALWIQLSRGELTYVAEGAVWTIPTPSGGWVGVAMGGAIGMALAVGLVQAGVLRQSFADYEAWEAGAREAEAQSNAQDGATAEETAAGESLAGALMRALTLTGPAVALMVAGFAIGIQIGRPFRGMAIGMGVGLLIGLLLRRITHGATEHIEPMWVQYPHARREMLVELLFLSPCLALGGVGWWLTKPGGPFEGFGQPPLWLAALTGSLLGLLVGGGLIWGIRILGTLAFGKEAMGLGDVHLMAAVGAVLGWIDPTIAFFVAPFFGIAWALLSVVFSRLFNVQGTALPYGPHLAAATIVVVLFKPLVELGLTGLAGRAVDLP